MMVDPKVSIIIPAYNPPMELFRKCIKCLLCQDYQNTEIIIVDDGSTASVGSEMDAFCLMDPRIIVLHQANGGIGAARNFGISKATGKYTCFVDADDFVPAGWLSYAVKLSDQNGLDICYGKIIKTSGETSLPEEVEKGRDFIIYEKERFNEVQKLLLLNHYSPLRNLPRLDFLSQGKLFLTKCVKNTLFTVERIPTEDQEFNLRILKQCKKVALTDAVSYYYYENPDSITHRYRPEAVDLVQRAMKMMYRSLLNDSEIYTAFCYRYFVEMINGIKLAYFSEKDKEHSSYERLKMTRIVLQSPEFGKVLKKASLDSCDKKSVKVKLWLLKHRIYLPVELFWLAKMKKVEKN